MLEVPHPLKPCLYIAIGDSITAGYGVRRGFVHFLAGRLREARPDLAWEVVNGGVSGDTALEALQRLDGLLVRPPGLVIVNFGVNDAFSGVAPDRFAVDLAALVNRVRRGGCGRIVLVSSEALPVPETERQVAPSPLYIPPSLRLHSSHASHHRRPRRLPRLLAPHRFLPPLLGAQNEKPGGGGDEEASWGSGHPPHRGREPPAGRTAGGRP